MTERAEDPSECVFCKIIEGSERASVIAESQRTIVFVSLEGHPLVVPKKHATDIYDENLDEETAGEMMIMARRSAQAMREVLKVEESNTFSASGENAGQEIKHFHLHIIPREPDDQRFKARHEDRMSREALDDLAQRIKSSFKTG